MKEINHTPVIRKRIFIDETPIIYRADSQRPAAEKSDAAWRIEREVKVGSETTVDVVGAKKYDQKIDDIGTIFPPAPFINTWSSLFDGSNDEARSAVNPLDFQFEKTDPFSVSFAMKTSLANTFQYIIGNEKDDATLKGWSAVITNNKMRLILRNDLTAGNDAIIVDANLPIVVNDWQHWVITYDGSDTVAGIKFYRNGALNVAPVTITDNLTGSIVSDERLYIGRRPQASSPFKGNIDEPTVWSKELSGAEAAEAHNIHINKQAVWINHSQKNFITSHWLMGDGKLFPLLQDQVGNNDLTILNADSDIFVQDVM